LSDEFDIIAVFWEDHISGDRCPIPSNPDDLFNRPTLSVGILLSETEKSLLLVSNIERYDERDETTFMAILKSTVVAIQKYGTIPLEGLRTEGVS
jgi:hypothetical protein